MDAAGAFKEFYYAAPSVIQHASRSGNREETLDNGGSVQEGRLAEPAMPERAAPFVGRIRRGMRDLLGRRQTGKAGHKERRAQR